MVADTSVEACVPVNAEPQPPSSPQPQLAAALRDHRRIWPYIVGATAFAAIASSVTCYRLWTAPVPLSVNDESSFLGELFVKVFMVLLVVGCTGGGALLGWLIGYIIRVLLPLSIETRNA